MSSNPELDNDQCGHCHLTDDNTITSTVSYCSLHMWNTVTSVWPDARVCYNGLALFTPDIMQLFIPGWQNPHSSQSGCQRVNPCSFRPKNSPVVHLTQIQHACIPCRTYVQWSTAGKPHVVGQPCIYIPASTSCCGPTGLLSPAISHTTTQG